VRKDQAIKIINVKQLLVFIRKEFMQVFRDPRTLLIMFGLPVVQIILFGYALTSEVKNVNILISDHSKDVVSTKIVQNIKATNYFIVHEKSMGDAEIDKTFKKGHIQCVLVFPDNFNNDLTHQGKASVQIITDGTDPNTAKTIVNYLTAIIKAYQEENFPSSALKYQITTQPRMLYNEEDNGSMNYIPGVMALILMLVCTALTSVSIVKEKELGTMEILLVSPIKPVMVLVAKAVPYFILSLINFTIILLLTVFLLHIEVKGSLLLLYLETALFILTCLSLGLLISNSTNAQQTALLISMMGMMLPTIIFTGFIFPLENMPWLLRMFANVVPSKWYFLIIKAVMLKGLGFQYVWKQTLVLVFMTLVILTIALKKFKIRLQ
jgi:ABC-2 type transport system permease protein